jgi:hypothetical protein
MRFAKHKGSFGALEAHHERTKAKYASNPDVDISKSHNNFHIVQPVTSYLRETNNRIQESGCKVRKDSVRFVDTIITASPEFFKDKTREEIHSFFQTSVDFLSQKIGKDNIFAAVVHMDEKTPHMHLCFTPITSDGRLCAKEIIGNRPQLVQWQDNFYEHMVSKFHNIERGESATETKRRHIPMRVFKQAAHLTRQTHQIKSALDSINPFNASKKKEEVIALLQKFFPYMENFETQVRKYKRTIDQLQQENSTLEKRVDSAEKAGIAKQLGEAQLHSDYHNLQLFVDSLPDEIKRQARSRQEKSQDKDRSL